jgi:hypothetical protein
MLNFGEKLNYFKSLSNSKYELILTINTYPIVRVLLMKLKLLALGDNLAEK